MKAHTVFGLRMAGSGLKGSGGRKKLVA